MKSLHGRCLVFSLLLAFAFLQGCYAGANKHVIYNDDRTEAYQLAEGKSVGLKVCDVKKTLIKTDDYYDSGYTKHELVNCRVMAKVDNWNKDLGTSTGPSLLQSDGGLGGAALIQDGLKNQPQDNIANSNQQGQTQGQSQTQRRR